MARSINLLDFFSYYMLALLSVDLVNLILLLWKDRVYIGAVAFTIPLFWIVANLVPWSREILWRWLIYRAPVRGRHEC